MSRYGKIPADCPYAVKSTKSFLGHDGNGYEAHLTFNGRKLGVAVNDGWGGGLQWHNMEQEAIQALDTYAKGLPNYDPDELFPEGLTMDGELLVEEMVGDFEEKKVSEQNCKRFAKFCSKEILFRLKGDKKGSWRSYKSTDLVAVKKNMAAKYGDTVEVVLNEVLPADPYAWERF